MGSDGRWVRLACDYLLTEWVDALGYPYNRIWPDVLNHVKLQGNNRGSCKAVSARLFARMYGIPEEDVQRLLDAAIAAGALDITESKWTVTGWNEYQSPEAERMRRNRAEQEVTVTNKEDLLRTNEPRSNSCHATETETKTGEPPAPSEHPPGGSKREVWVKPSPEEVAAFFKSEGSTGAEAKKFFNHFEANGWKAGRVPMKDWRAAARNWIIRSQEGARASPASKASVDPKTANDYLANRVTNQFYERPC